MKYFATIALDLIMEISIVRYIFKETRASTLRLASTYFKYN